MGTSCCFSARLAVAVYIRRLIIVALLKIAGFGRENQLPDLFPGNLKIAAGL
jgi:hypothetical protein